MILAVLMQDDHITGSHGPHLCSSRAVILIELIVQAVKGVLRSQIAAVDVLVIFHADCAPMLFDKFHIHKAVLPCRAVFLNLVNRIAVYIPLRKINLHFIKDF